MRKTLLAFGGLILLALALAACSGNAPSPAGNAAPPAEAAPASTVYVYKSPTCGCCGDWVDRMTEYGFEVQVEDVDNLSAIKAQAGVPGDLQSCHTALVDGYVIEGHVPPADVARLLAAHALQ